MAQRKGEVERGKRWKRGDKGEGDGEEKQVDIGVK